MNYYGNAMNELIDSLKSLPGFGYKSAQRVAFYLANQSEEKSEKLAEAIVNARKNVRWCTRCCAMTDGDLCPVCADPTRDAAQLMVVEDTRDMVAYEKTKGFKGYYHVLQGAISPLSGIEPADLKIKELLERLRDDTVREICIATNPTVEGETTALYLARIIKPLGIKVTRIANGIPVGGELEYIDEVTLSRAYEGRQEM